MTVTDLSSTSLECWKQNLANEHADNKLLAWIEPRSDRQYKAAFVSLPTASRRAPATYSCASPDEAREWVEVQAAHSVVDRPLTCLMVTTFRITPVHHGYRVEAVQPNGQTRIVRT